MKAKSWAVGIVLVCGLSACSGSDSDEANAPVVHMMPGVTGERLDAALGSIKEAGFDDDVEVEGGGTFGVVDESNWLVCEQTPAAGEPMTDAPKLTVDRSCGSDGDGDEDEDEATATTADTSETTTTTAPENLTVANNPELAELLAGGDCGDSIASFASRYRGQTIEFDGNIGAMQPHEDYDTRYDILILAGDFSTTAGTGPNFTFRDVNTTNDMHWTGDNPGAIGPGTNLRVVAEVGDYNADQCLFHLKPVSTQVR